MLVIEHLTRRYGDLLALDDISLEVKSGELVGLLGPNGAGKSTLLRSVAGLQPADSGVIRVASAEIATQPIEARRHLGYAAEEPTFYEDLSAEEYAAFVAAIRGLDPEEARRRTLELAGPLGLADRMREPVRGLSHGMRKKVSFLVAVLHRPAVLLCDEALEGFDAGAALAAKQWLREMSRGGAAILFSSHVTETMERLCDRVVLLSKGRIARTLERAAWGAPDHGPSPLERELLSLTSVAHPEN